VETEVSGENHRPEASHRQTFSHNVAWSTPRHEWDSNSRYILLVVIVTAIRSRPPRLLYKDRPANSTIKLFIALVKKIHPREAIIVKIIAFVNDILNKVRKYTSERLKPSTIMEHHSHHRKTMARNFLFSFQLR
jgi:hypothetical protein